MLEDNFWDDKKHSEEVINELNGLKDTIERLETLKEEIETDLEMCSLEEDDLREELISKIPILEEKLEQLEIETLFKGTYDNGNAIVEIQRKLQGHQ